MTQQENKFVILNSTNSSSRNHIILQKTAPFLVIAATNVHLFHCSSAQERKKKIQQRNIQTIRKQALLNAIAFLFNRSKI